MLIHSGEKPYECNVTTCKQKFRTYGHLKDHLSTHFDLRFFSCEICGLSFSRKWTLKKHMYTHTGEKPFECLSCKKKFADKSNLTTHMKKHKENSKLPKESINNGESSQQTPQATDFFCSHNCPKQKCGCESDANSNIKKTPSRNNLNLSTHNCDVEMQRDDRDDFSLFTNKDFFENPNYCEHPDLFFNSLTHGDYQLNDPFETEKLVYDLFKIVSEN